MATQWPRVKAWLVATIPTLPGLADVVVLNGPEAVGDSADRYVTVGFVRDDNGGTYQQMQAYDGTVWQEAGELRSEIVAQAGDSDPSLAEADCFAIADALDAKIRADRTLDKTLSPDGMTETTVEVRSEANEYGTATALVYVLRYTTTT
jgi:hypothetical protein